MKILFITGFVLMSLSVVGLALAQTPTDNPTVTPSPQFGGSPVFSTVNTRHHHRGKKQQQASVTPTPPKASVEKAINLSPKSQPPQSK